MTSFPHRNIWTGNVFLQEKPGSHSEHNVVLVDWTHCQVLFFVSCVWYFVFWIVKYNAYAFGFYAKSLVTGHTARFLFESVVLDFR